MILPILMAGVLVARANAGLAPVGAGVVNGKVYNEAYYPGTCWFTFSFSGRMPAGTSMVNVTSGSGRSSSWLCTQDAATDSDITVTMSGSTPSGPRTWSCSGHVGGASGSFDGFTGLVLLCRPDAGWPAFQWTLSQLSRGTTTDPDRSCDSFKGTCKSATFTASYTTKGKLVPRVPTP
ncbi:MAG: hypothetical protein ACJ735_00990 [Actinomycetes bacterium]